MIFEKTYFSHDYNENIDWSRIHRCFLSLQ